jgi:hypothetical protein
MMKNERYPATEEQSGLHFQSGFIAKLGRFLWQTKKWWMIPIILTILLLCVLIFLTGPATAPFIYKLF